MKKPKVLLLGNGLNRSFNNNVNWDDFLANLCGKKGKSKVESLKDIPYAFKPLALFSHDISDQLKANEKVLYGNITFEYTNYLNDLLSLGFDYILTTNYSYEIEKAILNNNEITDFKKYAKTLDNDRLEQKYHLKTYNSIYKNNIEYKVFHIHGEARKTSSIILSHYMYAELLKRIITQTENNSIKYHKHYNKNSDLIEINNWMDAFVLGDVYVIGFGFDYSEIDLWWLLENKSKQLIRGNTYFYDVKDGNNLSKKILFEALGVDAKLYEIKNEDFKSMYISILNDIKNNIN